MLKSWPPSTSPVSTNVLRPTRALVSAAVRPAMPEPTTATSNCSATSSSIWAATVRQHGGVRPSLFHARARELDDLLPLLGFGDDDLAEILRRAAHGRAAEIVE